MLELRLFGEVATRSLAVLMRRFCEPSHLTVLELRSSRASFLEDLRSSHARYAHTPHTFACVSCER
ncbi:hypothetical protein [Methanoculleus sp. 10]|uniref:hypothetical protein n=1 Tax=Methanoculleus sp. 10 TaxID=430615 RepID=UPI0025DB5C4A|nr:hypothetical protein [Methanoculleus sp. 10]